MSEERSLPSIPSILGLGEEYAPRYERDINFFVYAVDEYAKREGIDVQLFQGAEGLLSTYMTNVGFLFNDVLNSRTRYDKPIHYKKGYDEAKKRATGYWSAEWEMDNYPEKKGTLNNSNMSRYIYRVVANMLMDGVFPILDARGVENTYDFDYLKVILEHLGFDMLVYMDQDSLNQSVTEVMRQRYIQEKAEHHNDSIDTKRENLAKFGYEVGGIYLFAERSKGKNETKTQKGDYIKQSQTIDNERIKLVKLLGIGRSTITVEVLPKIQSYASGVMIYRELPRENREVAGDVLNPTISTIQESYDLYNIACEEGIAGLKEMYVLGKLDIRALAPDFPIWLGEVEGSFDPNGEVVNLPLTEPEYVRASLIQRGYEFNTELFDRTYGTSDTWYAQRINKITASHIDMFETPTFLYDSLECDLREWSNVTSQDSKEDAEFIQTENTQINVNEDSNRDDDIVDFEDFI